MGHDNGLKLFFPSAATSHHNADSNQVTLHLSATNNLVTTKWIAINLSIRIYNFISTIFLNWLHYFEEQLSFILSFGGQMCTMAGSWIHNRKPCFNFMVISRISLLQRPQPIFKRNTLFAVLRLNHVDECDQVSSWHTGVTLPVLWPW